MAMWHTFESRYVISATLKATTGLRVGAGGTESAQPAASDLPVLLGADDIPFIPGSSLRGVLRSQIERIVRTLEPIELGEPYHGRGACNPVVGSEWCLPSNEMRELRQLPDKELADSVWDSTCRVCRTFGSPWLASRVRIADLHLPAKDAKDIRIERRDGVSIHREKETVENKYDFETLPAGTNFELHIVAENLTESEFGLLWLGIQELKEGHIQVGGFKGRGLGWVKLEELKVQGVQANNKTALRRYLIKRQLDKIENKTANAWLESLFDEMEVG